MKADEAEDAQSEEGKEENKEEARRFPSDGPNKELIEMIEREMLTKTPNVHWCVVPYYAVTNRAHLLI